MFSLRISKCLPDGSNYTNTHFGLFTQCNTDDTIHVYNVDDTLEDFTKHTFQIYPADYKKVTFYDFVSSKEGLFVYCKHANGTLETKGMVMQNDEYVYFKMSKGTVCVVAVIASSEEEAENKMLKLFVL